MVSSGVRSLASSRANCISNGQSRHAGLFSTSPCMSVCRCIKLAFHDADTDILVDILARIVAWKSVSVSASWNSSFTCRSLRRQVYDSFRVKHKTWSTTEAASRQRLHVLRKSTTSARRATSPSHLFHRPSGVFCCRPDGLELTARLST